MDAMIAAAARALAAGAPLDALNCVALRGDAPALALRGIAMAQLGDFPRAKALVRSAARAFGRNSALARARCVVAEAEIALASRELAWPPGALEAARAVLLAHGDHVNAAHARYIAARRLLLTGRLDEAERTLAGLDPERLPPALGATHELIAAGIAMRRLRIKAARAALDRARRAARRAGVPSLAAEVENAFSALDAPAARMLGRGGARTVRLAQIEALASSKTLIVDACRRALSSGATVVPLARRPVLFALLRALGEAWPADVSRDELIARVFRMRVIDESHRGRLRVEMGRLRKASACLADVRATRRGYVLAPRGSCGVVVVAHIAEEKHAAVLALLADGESWSSSALALALGASQRTVQRMLDLLAAAGKAQSYGRGPARRWILPPVPGFTTTLLLPSALSVD